MSEFGQTCFSVCGGALLLLATLIQGLRDQLPWMRLRRRQPIDGRAAPPPAWHGWLDDYGMALASSMIVVGLLCLAITVVVEVGILVGS